MDIEVGAFVGDARDLYAAAEMAFGSYPHEEDIAHFVATFEVDRAIAATANGKIVGTTGAYSFAFTVPGAVVPAAGVTMVAVLPTHRRRGILRRMMRFQLDDVHARGEPVAILWASEGGIYQRYGYGLASLHASIRLARDRAALRLPRQPVGQVRLVDPAEARQLFPAIHDAIAPGHPGFFARSDAYWEHEFFPDHEHRREGRSAAFHVVHDTNGAADGYARYRIKDDWQHAGPNSSLVIVELMASNPDAHVDLWAYLLGVDLIGQIEAWDQPVDDPLLLLVAEPRRARATIGDALWLRIVDVARALEGRTYRADGELVFDLGDEFCDWNAGTWSMEVHAGRARVARSNAAAQIGLDVTDLAAVYLGAFSFAQLAAAGRVRELIEGGIRRADALFRTDRAPWCPRVF